MRLLRNTFVLSVHMKTLKLIHDHALFKFGFELILISLFAYSTILTNKNRYLTGISQLDIAAQQVGVMQEELQALEPKLKEASEIVSKILYYNWLKFFKVNNLPFT